MCFSSEHPDQVTISAGETFHYRCELAVHEPGPFVAELTIFLEDNGIREVTVTVRGTGVAPRAGDAPK